MDSILEAFMPYAPELINVLVVPFLIGLAVQGARYFGVEIQEKHKRTLQSALTTGANLALAKQLTGATAVQVVLSHVLGKGAPDAVKNFGLTTDELRLMAEAKLRQIANDPMTAALQQALK